MILRFLNYEIPFIARGSHMGGKNSKYKHCRNISEICDRKTINYVNWHNFSTYRWKESKVQRTEEKRGNYRWYYIAW
jgi:hypothetical protein